MESIEAQPKKSQEPINLSQEDMNGNFFVLGIQSLMEKEGIDIKEAFDKTKKEIDKTESYDSAYPKQIEMLKKAAEHLGYLG